MGAEINPAVLAQEKLPMVVARLTDIVNDGNKAVDIQLDAAKLLFEIATAGDLFGTTAV